MVPAAGCREALCVLLVMLQVAEVVPARIQQLHHGRGHAVATQMIPSRAGHGTLSGAGGETKKWHDTRQLRLRGGRARRGLARTNSDEEEWESEAQGESGLLEERQQLLMAAVSETPHDAFALGELGEFLWEQMGDVDAAEEMFTRAVVSNPHDVGALTDLAAFLCEERRQLDEAEQLYRRAVTSAPSDADALCCLADFLSHERSDLAGAAENYNKAVLHNPSDTDALCDFASFLVEQAQNNTAAEELLVQAIQCRPHAVDTLSAYAEFLRTQKKDLEGAGEYYRFFCFAPSPALPLPLCLPLLISSLPISTAYPLPSDSMVLVPFHEGRSFQLPTRSLRTPHQLLEAVDEQTMQDELTIATGHARTRAHIHTHTIHYTCTTGLMVGMSWIAGVR